MNTSTRHEEGDRQGGGVDDGDGIGQRPSQLAVILGVYLALACLFTWPLVNHLNSNLPIGSERSATISLFNLWTLSWNAQSVANLWSGYWDAPIFHPQEGAFGLSDPQPLTGFAFALVHLFIDNSFTVYNLLLLAILVLNGYGGYRLARCGCGVNPAALTGALAVGLSWVATELGVIQMTILFPVFLALEQLCRFATAPSYGGGARLAIAAAATYLCSSYFGLYLSLFLSLAAVAGLIVRRTLSPKTAKQVAVAAAVYLALLAPLAVGQLTATEGFARNEEAIDSSRASGEHYLRLRSRSSEGADLIPWLITRPPTDFTVTPQRLFPGTALILLAFAGFAAALHLGKKRREAWSFAALVAISALLSFGPPVALFGVSLYELLRDLYPGFAQLRSAFRFAAFVQVGLIGLAALGLQVLWCWRDRRGKGVAVGIVVLGLAELLPPAQRLGPGRAEIFSPPWIEEMRQLPAGPVAHLPPSKSGRSKDFEPIVQVMLQALEFDKPLLNGYSGYFPLLHREFRLRLRRFRAMDLQYLAERGTRYLLLDLARTREGMTDLLKKQDSLRLLIDTPEIQIYEFSAWTPSGV